MPVITFLTDFGLADHYVAAMKGVVLGICPGAGMVDISHEIPAYGIVQGAWTLSQAWPYFPKGTIHVAVVDPGVGSSRRPIAIEAGGHLFVAPDNGLLTMVLRAQPEYRAYEITEPEFMRPTVSQTFHGRDIFAPAAAHLANGLEPSLLGQRIEDPVVLDFGEPRESAPGNWLGIILHVDRFGNLVTNFEAQRFRNLPGGRFEILAGAASVTSWRRSYSEGLPGEVFLIAGSAGYVEICANRYDAAKRLGIQAGAQVRLLISD